MLSQNNSRSEGEEFVPSKKNVLAMNIKKNTRKKAKNEIFVFAVFVLKSQFQLFLIVSDYVEFYSKLIN